MLADGVEVVMNDMHVVVVGAGAMGGYFAALLAEAGHRVTLLARGATLDAVVGHGIRIEEPGVPPRAVTGVTAVMSLERVDVADIVLVCVKSWQVADIAPMLAPVVGERTVVMPVQNGVDAGDRLAKVLGPAHVAGGSGFVVAMRTGPGEFVRIGRAPSAEIGPLSDESPSPERLATVAEVLTEAGITCRVSTDMRRTLWRKLMFIASVGGVGAVSGASAGEIRAVARTQAMLEAAMREVAAVARAGGIGVTDGDIDRAIGQAERLDPDSFASMARDIAAGLPSELYDQTGAVVDNAEQLGVPTPVHSTIYAALLPREIRARGGNP